MPNLNKKKPRVEKEWEHSHTTIKKHYKHIVIPLGGLALVGTAATAVFLPLYIKAKAEDGLANFMDEDGTVPDYSGKPLKYVALGDSITAGYNGFFHGSDDAPDSKDYLSYADFLAKDLKNAGMLSDYKNYAKSGDTIWDTNEIITESQAVNNTIKDADLITISISSNDLLGAVTALGLPFATNLNKLMGNVQLPNHIRDAALGMDTNKGIGGSDTNKLLASALQKAAKLIYKGDMSGLLDIRDSYKDVILDIIHRGLLILTRDMHQAAPNAHIKYIMPEFPLIGVSKAIENNPTPVTGKSMVEFFDKDFTNAIKEGIKAQYTSLETFGDAFSDFISTLDKRVLELKKATGDLQEKVDGEKSFRNQMLYINSHVQGGGFDKPKDFNWTQPKDFTDTEVKLRTLSDEQLKGILLSKEILDKYNVDEDTTFSGFASGIIGKTYGDDNVRLTTYKAHLAQLKDINERYAKVTTDKERTIIANEFMTDFADIHPSVRGHQVMGSYLFDRILNETKYTTPAEEMYQFAVPFTDDNKIESFEEVDEIDWSQSTINKDLHLKNPKLESSTITNISRAINLMITQHPDGAKSPLKNILDILDPIMNSGDSISSDIYKINFVHGANVDNWYGIKGATPGFDVKHFVATLLKSSTDTPEELADKDKLWATLGTILAQELVASPDATANGNELHSILESFDANNNFNPDKITSGDVIEEVLTSQGITGDTEVAGAKLIDWGKVPATNEMRKAVEGNAYMRAHIITYADLFKAIDRSTLIRNINVFIKQKVAFVLSERFTSDHEDLTSVYDRAISIARELGLDELGDDFQKAKASEPLLDNLFKVLAANSQFDEKTIRQAIGQGVDWIITNVAGGITDPTKKALVDAAVKKYKEATKVTLQDGFTKLFDILHI